MAIIADEKTLDLAARIEQRAFDLFEQRGCVPGNELDDWLEAEREVLAETFRQTDELLICGPDGRAGLPVTGELAHVATAGFAPR